MREITWDKMIVMYKNRKQFEPFELTFYLDRPADSKGVEAFVSLIVSEIKGKRALVYCDDGDWWAVSAEGVYVSSN